MADGNEIDIGIVVGAVADKNSAKDAVNELAKGALSTLKDGYIPVPVELKAPIKGASKELLKAQEKVVSQWDKTFKEGFSSSKKDMNELVDIYLEFKRLAKAERKTSSGPVRKITALMGEQVQEYNNQRKAKRAEQVTKTSKDLEKRKNKSNRTSNVDTSSRVPKREPAVKIPAKSRTNVKTPEHVTETTLKETKYQGSYRSGFSRMNAVSIKEERPNELKSLKTKIVGVKKASEYIEKVLSEGKLYDSDVIRSRNKTSFSETEKSSKISKVALKEAGRLLSDVERGKKGEEGIEDHRALVQGSFALNQMSGKPILETILNAANSVIERYFKDVGNIELGGDEYTKGEGPGHELGKEIIKNTLDLIKEQLKTPEGQNAEYDRQMKLFAEIDPKGWEKLISESTQIDKKNHTLLNDILNQLKVSGYKKVTTKQTTNTQKVAIESDRSDQDVNSKLADISTTAKQQKKTETAILTQAKVEGASERVADSTEDTRNKEIIDVNERVYGTTNRDLVTGFNTDARAEELISKQSKTNKLTDKNNDILDKIILALSGITSIISGKNKNSMAPEEPVNTTGNPPSECTTILKSVLAELQSINVNVGNILQTLVNTTGYMPNNLPALVPGEKAKTVPKEKPAFEDKTNWAALRAKMLNEQVNKDNSRAIVKHMEEQLRTKFKRKRGQRT